jgi:copper transport outer membrane protein MctB
MINLRYHIVSLAATFLAFGLGILAGTTVIDQGLVSSLRQNTSALERDLNEAHASAADLQKQLDVWDQFGNAIQQPLLQGRLAGRALVVVVDGKTPGSLLSKLDEAFRFAGAKRPTRITLTSKWSLDAPAPLEQLRQALGIAAADPDSALQEAAARLGARLGGSADPRADGDPIRALADAGFLSMRDLPARGPFPAANALVAVVSSGDPQQVPAPDTFFVPLLKALSSSRVVAEAEPATADQSLAELIRADGSLSHSVCTVDHVDAFAGRLSLVYGLRDLAAGKAAQHYGVRSGATAVAPNLTS